MYFVPKLRNTCGVTRISFLLSWGDAWVHRTLKMKDMISVMDSSMNKWIFSLIIHVHVPVRTYNKVQLRIIIRPETLYTLGHQLKLIHWLIKRPNTQLYTPPTCFYTWWVPPEPLVASDLTVKCWTLVERALLYPGKLCASSRGTTPNVKEDNSSYHNKSWLRFIDKRLAFGMFKVGCIWNAWVRKLSCQEPHGYSMSQMPRSSRKNPWWSPAYCCKKNCISYYVNTNHNQFQIVK